MIEVVCPPLPAPLAPVHGPLPRLLHSDHRAPTPAGPRASIETLSSSPHIGPPGTVGLALVGVECLAAWPFISSSRTPSSHDTARFSPALEVEESRAQRPPGVPIEPPCWEIYHSHLPKLHRSVYACVRRDVPVERVVYRRDLLCAGRDRPPLREAEDAGAFDRCGYPPATAAVGDIVAEPVAD